MYKVLDCSDKNWDLYLSKIPLNKQDIYYTREYYKMYELNGDGCGKLFVFIEDEDKIGIYPFMQKKIQGYKLKEDYYDIETAYGYGGPITNCDEKIFIDKFEKSFLEYCKENNIIAEFVRFHPLLKNQKIFNTNIDILHNRTTVWLDLTKGIEKIWSEDIKSKNRNMIRKAEKSGLSVEVGKDLDNFKKIYNLTMEKVDADKYYYFNNNYYENIKENNDYMLLNVKKDNVVIASAIFMKYGEYMHYHLAGSVKEYLKYAPNNILLWEAIKYSCLNGYKKFHFGGGITNDPEDSLFKFKSSFSKDHADFYIGKRIHNQEIYNYLINEWKKKNYDQDVKILLQYRI